MKKSEAIEKLTALVTRIPDLEKHEAFGEEFTKWQHDARAVLKYVFPKERVYVKDFDEISYTLSFFVPGRTPEHEHAGAFLSGLRSARAMLQSRIDEVIQFWPDDSTSSAGIGESQHVQQLPAASGDRVFVIHGRQLLGEFHAFLRAIGLKPLEWSNARTLTSKPNPYTWEIVDTALSRAGAIVALMTPDDEARLQQHLWAEHDNALEKQFLSQPRQNVLFEAGVAYGRRPERTVLVRVGSHRPMTDLAGHHIVQLDDSPQSRQSVAEALRSAGCKVDLSGSDWFRAGSFSLPAGAALNGNTTANTESELLHKYEGQIADLKSQLQATSPHVVPTSFGRQAKPERKSDWPGLLLSNDGKGIAYDMEVLPFKVGKWDVTFDKILRLEIDEKVPSWIGVCHENVGDCDLRRHIVELQTISGTLGNPVPFKIVYRDSDQNRFASLCEFRLNVMNSSGLDVICISREPYSP